MEWKHICENGIRVMGIRNPRLHGFCASVYILAGSMYEEEKENGITHLMEHCVFRNLKKRVEGDFFELLTSHGLTVNACTYKEFVYFYVCGPTSGLPFATELLGKMFLPFDLTAEEYRTELQRVKAEIREEAETTTLSHMLNRYCWEGTTLERTICGSCKGLDRISRKKVEEYRHRILVPGNMLVYLTGNIPDDARELIYGAVERIPTSAGPIRDNTAPVPQHFGQRSLTIHRKNADYCYLGVSFDIDNTRISAGVRDLLYSVLFEGENALFYRHMSEEKALVYSYDSALEQYRNISRLKIEFEISHKDLLSAVRELIHVLHMVRDGAFSFDNCLRKLLTRWELMLDAPGDLNWSMAYENHILGAEPIEPWAERLGRYAGITRNDLMTAAREIFRTGNLTAALKGKNGTIPEEELTAIIGGL